MVKPAILFSTLLVACNGVLGIEEGTPFPEEAGAGKSDAASEAGDASGGDAGGGSGGSGGLGGGSGLGGGAGAGGNPAICTADFCAGFDSVTTPTEDWDVAEVVGTGQLSLEAAADAPSAPKVLRSELAAPDGGPITYHSARLSLQPSSPSFAESTPLLEMKLAISVGAVDSSVPATVANLRYGLEEHYVVIELVPQGKDHHFVAFPGPEGTPMVDLGVATLDEWHTLRIVVPKRSGAGGQPTGGGATVELDGVPKTLILVPAVLTPDLRFDLGLAIGGAAGGNYRVRYDDVGISYLE